MKQKITKPFFHSDNEDSPCHSKEFNVFRYHAVECVFIDSDGKERQNVLSPEYFQPNGIDSAYDRYQQAIDQAETNITHMNSFGVKMKYVIRLYHGDRSKVEETTVT